MDYLKLGAAGFEELRGAAARVSRFDVEILGEYKGEGAYCDTLHQSCIWSSQEVPDRSSK